mgnify:CR=1 FL=1
MLKRKIEQKLTDWKNTKGHKPLIIKGCRQCGKTFSVMEFARANYKHVVYMNFFENPDYASVFTGSLEIDNIIMMVSALLGKNAIFEKGETVLVLDEIQECPEARTALKFFKMDGRFDVIGTGSLLGVKGYGKEPRSIPVGYETVIDMYPLDFEEFLWGMGITEDMIDNLRGYLHSKTVIPEAVHSQMMNYYRQYIATGGMPEVVQKYMDTRDFREVDKIQRSLLQGYQYDIAHYATAEEKVKAEKCYLSLAKQLLDKENHKFQYKEVEHGGRAQKYFSSIEWLLRADMVLSLIHI